MANQKNDVRGSVAKNERTWLQHTYIKKKVQSKRLFKRERDNRTAWMKECEVVNVNVGVLNVKEWEKEKQAGSKKKKRFEQEFKKKKSVPETEEDGPTTRLLNGDLKLQSTPAQPR